MKQGLFARTAAHAAGSIIVIVSLALSMVSGAFAPAAVAAAASDPIDLPAAVPTVAQIDKAGLTGLVPNGAADVTLAEYLQYSPAGTKRDQREKDMKAAGFVHQYEKYWTTAEASESGTASTTQLLTYAKYFETESGAKKGYTAELTNSPAKGTKDDAFGDSSEITTYKTTSNGTSYTAYDILVRVGRVTGGVSLLVTADSPAKGKEISLIEKLAPYIVKDFTAADSGKTPNLGLYAPVYDSPAGPVGGDGYYFILGKVTGLNYGETQDQADSRAQYYTDNKAEAVYDVNQSIDPSGNDPYTSNYSITTQLWAFNSTSDAASWLNGQNDDVTTNSSNTDVKSIKLSSSSLPDGVDDAAAFTYAFAGNSGFTTQVNATVGKIGFIIYIDSTIAIPGKASMLALLGVVSGCITNGTCDGRVKVPADVTSDVNKLDKELPPSSPAAPATPTGGISREILAA